MCVNISCWHQHSSESGEMADDNNSSKDKLVSNVVYLLANAMQHLDAENQATDTPSIYDHGQWCGDRKYLCDSEDTVYRLQRMPDSDSNDGFTFTVWVKNASDGPVKFKTYSHIDNLDIFELEALSLAEHVPSVDQGQQVNVTSLDDGSLNVKKKSSFVNLKGYLNSLDFSKVKELEQAMNSSSLNKTDRICV